ncbi:MAG: cytochrome c biosis protein transrane region [Bacteroidetes bacterium]|nr:cytochrome c biosis protein transrane region [Bacteroidota bacterium]
MISRVVFQLVCVVLTVSVAVGQVPQSLKTSSGKNKHHTSIELVSSVKTIRPGGKFLVGVLMKMDPGWHTYWKNSGESGLPTQIDWRLPEGFTAGEIQWPLPHKYNESGDILTYGYEAENMLIVEITAPSSLQSDTQTALRANVHWLECENICIPGDDSVEVTLPVLDATPAAANMAIFDKYRLQIPRSFSESNDFSFTSSLSNSAVEIHLIPVPGKTLSFVKDKSPDFYPEPIEEISTGRTQISVSPNRAILRVPLSVFEKVFGPFALRGVVVYQMEGEERSSVAIAIPLPKEFCAGLSVGGDSTTPASVLDQHFTTVALPGIDQPLYVYVLYAILGGLLMNIMPCVLPVIGLKIFGLVKISGDDPKKVKKLGLMFSFGILASFLVLALLVIVLKSAGEQVGWGFQFQEPLFVIAMSAVVFAFGLSLFGVYEINLPFVMAFASVGSMLEKKAGGRREYAASFGEGVFATILATPCTAPLLGTALGFAFSQSAWIILLIFSSVAFGMAMPYLLLTTRPAWMRFIPKPGEWMVTAKQFMGFLMMATLLWLLYVLGKQLGMEAVIWTCAFLLTIGISCWVIGRFATLNATRAKYATTWIFAVAIAAGGYWFFLESVNVIAGVSPSTAVEIHSDSDDIQWQPFTLAGLDAHIKENKTVFIDFTADWCLTCKVNEKAVLTDRGVVGEFKSKGIVAIKADWTNRNPEITKLLRKFGRSGVPLYVVFPAGRPGQPIVLPEIITSGIVLEAIASAVSIQAVAQP